MPLYGHIGRAIHASRFTLGLIVVIQRIVVFWSCEYFSWIIDSGKTCWQLLLHAIVRNQKVSKRWTLREVFIRFGRLNSWRLIHRYLMIYNNLFLMASFLYCLLCPFLVRVYLLMRSLIHLWRIFYRYFNAHLMKMLRGWIFYYGPFKRGDF